MDLRVLGRTGGLVSVTGSHATEFHGKRFLKQASKQAYL